MPKPISILLAAAPLALFAWLAAGTLNGQTDAFDAWMRAEVHRHAQPVLTGAMRLATLFGSSVVFVLGGIAGAGALLRRGVRKEALAAGVWTAGALALNHALKTSFQRARPEPWFGIGAPDSYSFPSGHALFAVCLYGAAAAVATARIRSRTGRLAVCFGAALVIGVVGLSRIYLGVHHPTDVIAGFAAGAVWLAVGGIAWGRREAPPEQ